MSTERSHGIVVCVNPAFTYPLETGDELSGEHQFSLEMVKFIVDYFNGQFSHDNDSHTKCVKIINRRGCYKEPILDEFHLPTAFGNHFYKDAKTMNNKIIRYYRNNYQSTVTILNATKMDEIIPYGKIGADSIFMLKALYQLHSARGLAKNLKEIRTPEKDYWKFKTTNLPKSISGILPKKSSNTSESHLSYLPYSTSDTEEEVVLMSSVRNKWKVREGVDVLIKFGLVDLYRLPRFPESNGKGQPPVAFGISRQGILFYQDYIETFDPKHVKWTQLQAERPEYDEIGQINPFSQIDTPSTPSTSNQTKDQAEDETSWTKNFPSKRPGMSEMSDGSEISDLSDRENMPIKKSKTDRSGRSGSSDIVDGENLREIFGP